MPIHLVPHDPRTFPTKSHASQSRRVRESPMLSTRGCSFRIACRMDWNLCLPQGIPTGQCERFSLLLINFNRILTRRLSFFNFSFGTGHGIQ